MSEDERREAASKGGKAAHASGNANKFDSESGKRAGQIGGQSSGTQADFGEVENM